MKLLTTIQEFRQAKSALPGSWSLVPTMGYLHEGHLSLVKRARAENEFVAASIFVNPTQFGPNEDLAAYPRDLPRDLKLLAEAGVDLVWTPTPEIMYPPGFQTWVTVEEVTRPLEGGMRPGHFRGVATVVAKLFNAVQPDKAYFGQKDAQQAVVIRQMARDLNFNLEVVICPIVREPDGLAMSSRNTYLNPEERRSALCLKKSLDLARDMVARGETSAARVKKAVEELILSHPFTAIDYINLCDHATLEDVETVKEEVVLALAVKVGRTRLIDNGLLREV